jgi:hypothetical protein
MCRVNWSNSGMLNEGKALHDLVRQATLDRLDGFTSAFATIADESEDLTRLLVD